MEIISQNKKKTKAEKIKEILRSKKLANKEANKRDLSVYDGGLIHLPFFDLSKKSRTSGKVIREIKINDTDYSIVFLKGVPNELGQNIFMYFLTLIPRYYDVHTSKSDINISKLEKEGVSFTFAEVCRALDLNPNDFRQRQRIKEELRKIGNISVGRETIEDVGENELKAKHYVWDHVGIMKVSFYESQSIEQHSLWKNNVRFYPQILENIGKQKYRLFNFKLYKNLHSVLAMRLYIIFGGHSNTKENQKPKEWKIGLLKLAEQIPLKQGPVRNLRLNIKKGLNDLKKNSVIKNFNFYFNENKVEIVHVFY